MTYVFKGKSQDITPDTIIEMVEEEYRITAGMIKGPRRNTEIKRARFVAIKLIKDRFSLSLKQIGQHIGGRDHSSIIHALKQVNDITHPGITARMNKLKKQLNEQERGYTTNLPSHRMYKAELV